MKFTVSHSGYAGGKKDKLYAKHCAKYFLYET